MDTSKIGAAGRMLRGVFDAVDAKVDIVRQAGYPMADYDPGTRRISYTDAERALLDLAETVLYADQVEVREQAVRELADAIDRMQPGVVLDDGRVVRVLRTGQVQVFDTAAVFDRDLWGPGGRTKGKTKNAGGWQFVLPEGTAAGMADPDLLISHHVALVPQGGGR